MIEPTDQTDSARADRKAAAMARQADALKLRLAGATYERIADELGYKGHSGAYRAVQRALRRMVQEPGSEVLALELARLDRLMLGIWSLAVGSVKAGPDGKTIVTAPDFDALDRVLKLMDRRARYMGLDAPTKTENVHKTELEVGEAARATAAATLATWQDEQRRRIAELTGPAPSTSPPSSSPAPPTPATSSTTTG